MTSHEFKVIEREKRTVDIMVRLFCRRRHGSDVLCDDCTELLSYAHCRLDKCRHKASKPSCKRCTSHCYNADMRAKIRTVMRYSGPRLIFHAPLIALRHLTG